MLVCWGAVKSEGIVCVPPGTAAFTRSDQRSKHQVPGASRGEAGRAAADAHTKAIDGGTLASTFIHARTIAAASEAPQ